MRLRDSEYEYIKEMVSMMFVDYNISGVPINVFQAAEKMGIELIKYSSLPLDLCLNAMEKNADGFSIETNNAEWIIYYNDITKDDSRINQTIMHEIGHYILGHTNDGETEESEAKFFAKYALAPPPLIHNMEKQITIDNIMSTFQIGYEAASYAYRYYHQWKEYGADEYLDYEKQILSQILNI